MQILYRFPLLVLLASCFAHGNIKPAPWEDMLPVGKSTLRVAIWRIYDAELLSQSGQYKAQQPFALQITYLRTIRKDHLVKETEKQWKKIYDGEKYYKDEWLDQLFDIFPNVKKGDNLTFFVDGENRGSFYFNGKFLGAIDDPNFSKSFSGIWLSEKTTRPRLRKQLIGE